MEEWNEFHFYNQEAEHPSAECAAKAGLSISIIFSAHYGFIRRSEIAEKLNTEGIILTSG